MGAVAVARMGRMPWTDAVGCLRETRTGRGRFGKGEEAVSVGVVRLQSVVYGVVFPKVVA